MISHSKRIVLSMLLISPLFASEQPLMNNFVADSVKRDIPTTVKTEEAKADLSNTPWTWRVKREVHEALFARAGQNNFTNTQKPLPGRHDESHEIVELTTLGFPLKGAVTLKKPPKNETNFAEKFGSKALTLLLNHLSLDESSLPTVPRDRETLSKILFPKAYTDVLPKPSFPAELSAMECDKVGGCALSGPFANHIAKATKEDLARSPFANEDPAAFHVINLDRYEAFPVKEGYEKLGGKALLQYNKETKMMQTVAIRHEGVWYQPTDTFFPQAQKIMMSTLTTETAMIRHLLKTHVLTAGLFSAVTHTSFQKDHPLREFLHAHQYGTISTNNYKLPILISGEGAMFPSLFSFDEKGVLNVLQHEIDHFDIFSLDAEHDLTKRGMKPTQGSEVDYPYGNVTLKLWELTETYVTEVVQGLYKNDNDVTQDASIQKFYDLLEKHMPNGQLKAYAPQLDRANLIRLLTLHIYNESVEHYIVGTMAYHFQSWAADVPFSVRRDGSLPTIGEAQNAANLLFATQPSYAYGEVDRPSDGLSETNTKLALRKYQTALLQMHRDIDQSIRSKAVSRFDIRAIQAAVNS